MGKIIHTKTADGKTEIINTETGEILHDTGFLKLFLDCYIRAVKPIASNKECVCFWIMEHMNRNNQLKCNQRQIAKETGFSLDTVNKALKALQKTKFICKTDNGYMVNPDIIFYGISSRRSMARGQFYATVEAMEKNKEKNNACADNEHRLLEINDKIKELQKEKKKLEYSL